MPIRSLLDGIGCQESCWKPCRADLAKRCVVRVCLLLYEERCAVGKMPDEKIRETKQFFASEKFLSP